MPHCSWRSKAEPKYKCREHVDIEGGRCILHDLGNQNYPRMVEVKLEEKALRNDFDFKGAILPSGAQWPSKVRELSRADFSESSIGNPSLFTGLDFLGPTNFATASFFSGVDMTDTTFAEAVTFTAANFALSANFLRATFQGDADFTSARFRKTVSFSEAVFHQSAHFNKTHFEDSCSFHRTVFSTFASFLSAVFIGSANLSGSRFGTLNRGRPTPTQFMGATFFRPPSFDNSRFLCPVSFHAAVLDGGAVFRRTLFDSTDEDKPSLDLSGTFLGGEVLFADLEIRGIATLERAEIAGNLKFDGPFYLPRNFNEPQSWTETNPKIRFESVRLRPAARVRFESMDLSRVTFLGTNVRTVEFHNVRWPRRAIGLEVRPPLDPGLVPRLQYQLLRFLSHQTTWDEWQHGHSEGARRVFRDLKASLEDQRDYADAGDLYYAEMGARRRGASVYQKPLLWLYWLFCGYGEKPLRAVGMFFCIWLVLTCSLMRTQFTFDSSASWRDPACRTSGCRPSFREATGQSIRALTLQQGKSYMQPYSPSSHTLGLLANALGPTQLGLFFLAMRRRFRR